MRIRSGCVQTRETTGASEIEQIPKRRSWLSFPLCCRVMIPYTVIGCMYKVVVESRNEREEGRRVCVDEGWRGDRERESVCVLECWECTKRVRERKKKKSEKKKKSGGRREGTQMHKKNHYVIGEHTEIWLAGAKTDQPKATPSLCPVFNTTQHTTTHSPQRLSLFILLQKKRKCDTWLLHYRMLPLGIVKQSPGIGLALFHAFSLDVYSKFRREW